MDTSDITKGTSLEPEPELVFEAIKDLLDRHLIEICNEPPYVVNPLTVSVQNSSKKRLILDLREVNKHLWKQSIRYEDIKVRLTLFRKVILRLSLILASAYHFV